MASSVTASKRCRLLRLSLFHREDSSSEVFPGPDGMSAEKAEVVQLRHPRQTYQQMAVRPRSQSGSDPPGLKKAPHRPHSICWDTFAALRGKKGKAAAMKSSSSAGSQDRASKEADGLQSLSKKRGPLSLSSSSPAGLMRTSTSSSVDELDWGDVGRGGGGGGGGGGCESGYCGSEDGCGKSGGTPSPGTPMSPPQPKEVHRPGVLSGLQTPNSTRASAGHVRSSSSPSCFSTALPSPSSVSTLREVDIVGESSRCRFPWQRDIAVQCSLAVVDPPPPFPLRRSRQDRSSSSSSQHSAHNLLVSSLDSPPLPAKNRNACHDHTHSTNRHRKLGNSSSLQGVSSTDTTPAASVARRANFSRKPRPSSMGSLDNPRYHSELSRFRELVTWRGERGRGESPPLLQSPPACWRRLRGERKAESPVLHSPPGGWIRAASVFKEDGDSVSDLESILEYPDEW